MNDQNIISLFIKRIEDAINQLSIKYKNYLYIISFNILKDKNDAEECLNDTYLKVWDSIPPNEPKYLKAYVGKITRNLSLNIYTQRKAQKRNSGEMDLALSELENCIPSTDYVENIIENSELTNLLNIFLESLSEENRIIFLKRYWYVTSISDISKECSISESKVKSSLFRTRNQLKIFLEKEGVRL